jgi:hypothetical protein
MFRKCLVFSCLVLNGIRAVCWGLLNPVEAEGFEQLQNHLQYCFRRMAQDRLRGESSPVKTRSSANRAEVRASALLLGWLPALRAQG